VIREIERNGGMEEIEPKQKDKIRERKGRKGR